MKDSSERLSPITLILHWVVAITVITLASLGLYMAANEAWGYYDIHKSVGVIIFGIILIRVVWRLYNGLPRPVGKYSKWEHSLAKVVHWTLIICTVLLPITGMMYSGFSGHGFGVFDLTLVETNPDPEVEWGVIPYNEFLSNVGHNLHSIIGYVLIVSVVLHVLGALKHHIKDKDRTIRRMLSL